VRSSMSPDCARLWTRRSCVSAWTVVGSRPRTFTRPDGAAGLSYGPDWSWMPQRTATSLRSPVRPNPIALAVVELIDIEGSTLTVRNVDCVDGTPLLDIKPYFASTDCFPDAKRP